MASRAGRVLSPLHIATRFQSSAVVLRRALPQPQALRFVLSRSEALRGFDDWAEKHDAAGDLSQQLRGGKWKRQDGVSLSPMYVPMWSFDVHTKGGTDVIHVYAGSMDAISIGDTCAAPEALPSSALAALEPLHTCQGTPIPDEDRMLADVEAVDLPSAIAWEAAIAQGASPSGLTALRLVYLPVWRCEYQCLGVPLDAFVCGRTGLASGLSHRGFGRDVFEQLEAMYPDVYERLQRAVVYEQQISRLTDGESSRALMSAASVGLSRMATIALRVVARHPKVALAVALTPLALNWLKPLAVQAWRAMQARGQRSRRDSTQAGREELDSRADWEELLRRGEERCAADDDRHAGASHAGGRRRDVDLGDPRDVLGLPASGRISRRQLDLAFRRELLLWHPGASTATLFIHAPSTLPPVLCRLRACDSLCRLSVRALTRHTLRAQTTAKREKLLPGEPRRSSQHTTGSAQHATPEVASR